MLPIRLAEKEGPLNILCIGAHSDDIEIGCGGAMLTLRKRYPDARIVWVVLSGSKERQEEAERAAAAMLGDADYEFQTGHFRDGFFPYQGLEVKEFFESLKKTTEPDVIFTHHRNDLHQDHRLVSELTRNTWRAHFVLEYEIPKYDADLGHPNTFVPLEPDVLARKIAVLMEYFGTQRSKQWFDEETFRGLMRLRGIECASPTGYAEAFHAPKLLLLG
ncbi:MAG: PIG-L family deacetylase [Candidatus Hydrogenedens sp.]|nr:PIG-L family deacetylase [Candidatus Hydrogenedens sp.]